MHLHTHASCYVYRFACAPTHTSCYAVGSLRSLDDDDDDDVDDDDDIAFVTKVSLLSHCNSPYKMFEK